jgi:hypothetical protein
MLEGDLPVSVDANTTVEIRTHYWQVGRAAVDFGPSQYAALLQEETSEEDVG